MVSPFKKAFKNVIKNSVSKWFVNAFLIVFKLNQLKSRFLNGFLMVGPLLNGFLMVF